MALLMADRIDRPAIVFGGTEDVHGGVGGGPTLDDAIAEAWEGLVVRAAVACPLCGGTLRPRPSGAGTAGGRCESCGTTLA